MNFLLRASPAPPPSVDHAPQPVPAPPSPTPVELSDQSKQATTLEGLISDEKLKDLYANEDRMSRDNGSSGATYPKDHTPIPNRHVDVAEDEGWITIPYRELPDNWNDVKDIHSFRSLDRSFVFPGEQVHILACLSASQQSTEIITPFKLAAVMCKNGTGQNGKHQNGNASNEDKKLSISGEMEVNRHFDSKDGIVPTHINDTPTKAVGESIIRMEDNRRHTQTLLQRFNESHFFVRIAESDELLWSKRGTADTSGETTATHDTYAAENDEKPASLASINAFIDKGRFDARVSGGVARNSVKCFSLPSGDIVVLLQVNVGVDSLKDPTLEILQFEKYKVEGLSSEKGPISTHPGHDHIDKSTTAEVDPCGELLKWLLPLDNSITSPTRPLSPPLNSTTHKGSFSGASGTQLFSFSHFRSYSMSSISQVQPNVPTTSPSQAPSTSSKPSFELEDWDRFASQKFVKSQKTGSEGILSFRGVPLEPERFSVRCGLEGIYVPGRRWRKHLEIVQPIEIHTFAADCNTDDLLCVQIKNVSPAHIQDIIVYIDAVTIIFEETSRGGTPSSIPVTCIESGAGYSLPNLALRRGEEHSFILKPATSMLKFPKIPGNNRVSQSPHSKTGKLQASLQVPLKPEDKKTLSTPDKYAVLVSCRCNYTESRLFFKKSTNWKPRISRDLMISVASEISQQNIEHDGRVSQLPVQVLTLQASNLTPDDLTLTVLAPASITSPRSVVTLNSRPSSPTSPFVGFSTTERLSSLPLLADTKKEDDNSGVKSLSFDDQKVPISDVIPTTALACNHLWLQSRVPLGCVPSQSTATVKLELLPLTDGIITLDTLQINVKEKGATYIPEHSLKINATSSVATGIF